jgi:hypothetical protein
MGHARWFSVAASAAALIVVSAGLALSGEVKGPSGTVDNTNTTAAPTHANSIAAYSGLNDNDSAEGQTELRTQTPADSFKIYGGSHGCSGGSCVGGTNPNRIPPN